MRNLLVVGILAIVIGGCGPAAPVTPFAPAATPTASATAEQRSPGTPTPPMSHDPGVAVDPTPLPSPALAFPGTAQVARRALLRGMRRDVRPTCRATADALPRGALAAIDCRPDGAVARRLSAFLFETQDAMLAAYDARVAANRVPVMSHGGRCVASGPSEGGYVPGDGHPGIVVVERSACWVGSNGHARYHVTLPPFALLVVEGTSSSPSAVERWAWLGNLDQPGAPTLWRPAR